MTQPFFWIGTWNLSGFRYGFSDQQESIRVLQTAIDHNISTIDTSYFYGEGASLNIIKKAIKNIARDKVTISSKGGLLWNGGNVIKSSSPPVLEDDLNRTLKILSTDYIDIYQLHWPSHTPEPLDDVLSFLLDQKKQGKIKAIGINNLDPATLTLNKNLFTSLNEPIYHQIHASPLTKPGTWDFLKTCKTVGCQNIATGIFEQGFLLNPSLSQSLGKKDVRRKHALYNKPMQTEAIETLKPYLPDNFVLPGEFDSSGNVEEEPRLEKGERLIQQKDILAAILKWVQNKKPDLAGAIISPRTCEQLDECLRYVSD